MHTRPLSTTEAAARLGKSRETARRMAASGKLPAERVENRWLLDPDAVHALAREREEEAAR